MKLAIASLLVGSAAAFAPAATPMRNSALNMATETTTEKVRHKLQIIKQLMLKNLGEIWCCSTMHHEYLITNRILDLIVCSIRGRSSIGFVEQR